MMKPILFIIFVLSSFLAKAQYNNEWIDYSKTYYKFPVGKSGIYRITESTLQTIGLANTPATYFQLWRNGTQLPLYTSVASGVLGAGGYLEFWGEMNDGKPDTKLYPNINDQLSDKWSLETDTASFFLTVNPLGGNLRINNDPNNVAANTLPAEPYFMYTYGSYFKNKINPGNAGVVGEYVYSSVYDKGEGFTCNDIRPASPLNETINSLFVYTSGPDSKFYIAGAGYALNNRNLRVHISNTQVVDAPMDSFQDLRQEVNLPMSLISSATVAVKITNTSSNPNDRMVVSKYEITYPRQFNFGGSKNFLFELPATSTGNFLKITNFSYGTAAPLLYDLSNHKRYTGDITETGIVKFALPPSIQNRKLVLINGEATNINQVSTVVTRNFINYGQSEYHGNYIIISNAALFNGANGNPVEAYRQYRSSSAGGGYTAKIYDIDQLTDQFAFGIKRHPSASKSFLKYAEDVFQNMPQAVFLIGKGVNYIDARMNEANPLLERLNLVPSFGHPASDNLLAARDNETISKIPVGRLSVVTPSEIEIYLEKVKEYEAAAANSPQTVEARGWMKNVVHAIGGGDAALSAQIGGYMGHLKTVIEDTLYGAHVINFTKSSAVASQLTTEGLKQLFAEGIGIVNYFGHSSASTLEFNIDDPYIYNNAGKYPLFFVNGCLAGDIFMFDQNRFNVVTTLSEKYVLANQRGSIGFIASSHFGIVNYLNSYLTGLYQAIAQKKYGHSIGETLEESFRYLLNTWGGDFFARIHAEEITLHGDPAIKFYAQPKPDFVVEDQMVIIPPIISSVDNSFKLGITFLNIGNAVSDSITIDVKRQLPDGTLTTIIRKRIIAVKYSDSLNLTIPVNGAIEKGENKFIVSIDVDDEVLEISESNNTVTKSFFILENEIRPIYPYNYSIVNKGDIKFYGYATHLTNLPANYLMEIDTTEFFNSSIKQSLTINSIGGVIEFKPNISYSDNTVYYWRTTTASNDNNVWNKSSFLYNTHSTPGYNQSHYFQHTYDKYDSMSLKADRKFYFDKREVNINAKVGLYPSFQDAAITISRNDERIASWLCEFNVLQIVVFDGKTSKPWKNFNVTPIEGRFGSRPLCHLPPYSFSYQFADSSQRRKAMQMLDSIPSDNFVMIYWTGASRDTWTPANKSFIKDWMADTASLGSNKSLYHKFKSFGLNKIDSFTRNIPFLFFFKKGDQNYPIFQEVGENQEDYINEHFTLEESMEKGSLESPWFGPALKWNELHWNGHTIDDISMDSATVDIYGKDNNGNESLLTTVRNARDTNISFIDSKIYPYLKLKLHVRDTVDATPYQLSYWTLNGVLPPEGSIAPNLYLKAKDTVEIGEKFNFAIAFKNISETAFDSLKLTVVITDSRNVPHRINLLKSKPLIAGDTIIVSYEIDTKEYPGFNSLFVDVNPDNDQPEQYHFNNYAIHNFFVKSDNFNPLLDVTFDGVHILNNDIVSAKPHILIQLKDDNKFMALDDTALMKVQVRYPDGSYRTFSFNNDTLRFTAAPVNPGGADNTASIDFNPSFLTDGDYELVVSGRDRSGNKAGQTEYRVSFKIINKPMISNMFNYPNPFTTSTAFVFTLTGSELPQNIRIQVLTITGKIVREITKEELGPIRIGRNITDFKWDGTDQYGQKLANGVYLYRVITNLNGKSLDRYKTEGDNTDQYFNKGYGKMYLMR